MGSGHFLPCCGAGRGGQWVWLAGRDSRGLINEGALGFGFLTEACGERERERERHEELKKKNKTFFLPLLHVQGKKKEEQCRSKQHRSVLSLFFFLA
jgi:hypothetical protein